MRLRVHKRGPRSHETTGSGLGRTGSEVHEGTEVAAPNPRLSLDRDYGDWVREPAKPSPGRHFLGLKGGGEWRLGNEVPASSRSGATSPVPKTPKPSTNQDTERQRRPPPVLEGPLRPRTTPAGGRGSDELPAAPAAGCVEAPALRAASNPVSLWIPGSRSCGRGNLG